ncbi:MAG TPA: prenyltransferase/squalene oxidase repeat-containing protein, partial [Trichormus sp.]
MTDAHIRDADSVHLIDDARAKTIACIGKNFSDGSWPYIPGAAPSTEATAWCMLALRNTEAANKANLAAQWLIDKQNADGGWSTAPAAGKS